MRDDLELIDGVYPEFDVETYRSAEVAPVFFGSAKSIENNGGILENEVVVDGVVEQRYWIDLDKVRSVE